MSQLRSVRYLWEFKKDPIALMAELQRAHGDSYQLSLGHKRLIFCFHPDHAEHVLRIRADRYVKSRLIFDKITPLTGKKGLVQLEGSVGMDQRHLTSQSLST